MKNIINFSKIMFAAVLILSACSPKEFDEYSLGQMGIITPDNVTFSYAKATTSNPSNSDNVIQFTNTSDIKVPHSFIWDLGNGIISSDKNPIGKYPDKGTYTVSLSVFGSAGNIVIKTQTVIIAKDDPTLFDTPTFRNLTGGPANQEGKTWVFDQHNLYTAEVRTALDADIRGHMGLGPIYSFAQGWWGAGPNEKGDWKMYDFKFHFKQTSGLQMKITTDGVGYGRLACAEPIGGYKNVSVIWDQDVQFPYEGGDYTFSINDVTAQIGEDEKEYEKITLSGDAFMGYYCGTQDYYILYLTDEVMALCARNTVEGHDWIFIFIREDLNIDSTIYEDQINFTVTPGSDEFTFNYSVTVDNPDGLAYTCEVQFGDGVVTSALTGSHTYIVKAGDYNARCVLTVGNKTRIKQQTVTINNDHPLYDININIAGGKAWRLRPHSQGSGIVLTRTWTGEVWWTVDANASGSEAAYDDILTFYNSGKAKLENFGNSYMNEATWELFPDGNKWGSFVTLHYFPSENATWEFVVNEGVIYLKLTNVFPMYALNPAIMQEGLYEVLLVSANLLHIKYVVGNDEWDPTWHYYLVPVNQ